MSRKKKLLFSTLTASVKQIISLICGFLLPRYMILYYGSSVNGLVSSITNFLSFISLLDMGVGSVIQANLYEPIAQKNVYQINKIVVASEKFFRKLAYIFLAYILGLMLFVPQIGNNEFSAVFTCSLIFILAISIFSQYFFGMTNQLLLNADQKAYVPLGLQSITIILNTFLSILLIKQGASIHFVKLTTAAIYILRPIGQMVYVRLHYNINKKIYLVEDPIKQKWNGFSQHLASVICQNIDIAVLTIFSTLENVSIYSVYFSIISGVELVVLTSVTGIEALLGSLIANRENERLSQVFSVIEWGIHFGVTTIFTITAITITPFVSVYTYGVEDVNYVIPEFGMLLVTAYGMLCLRIPYFRVIKAAGHFKETQNGAYISAFINVMITVVLVFKLGIIGVAIGTLVAMLYHTLYYVWYLKRNILFRPYKIFIKYFLCDVLIAIVSYIFTKAIVFNDFSYIGWLIYAFKVSLSVITVSIMVNFVCGYKKIISMIRIVKKR